MPLNPVARAAIEELRRVFHVTDLTPDEIVELNDLGAAQMAAGKSRGGEVFLSPPLRVGSIVLHPLTCAGLDFVDRWEGENMSANAKFGLVPFALAFGRQPEELAKLITASDVERRIEEWLATVDVSRGELEDACTAILRGRDDIFGTDIKTAIVQVCDWMEVWNPGLAAQVREESRAALDSLRKERESEYKTDSSYWRRISFELGAMTGVEPDYWYRQDRALTLVAYKTACERESARAGIGRKDGEKPELIAEIAKQRKAILRIVELRKNARKESGKENAE